MAGTFRFRYSNSNPIIKVLPANTTGGNIQSTDVGKLCVGGSTQAGTNTVFGELPIASTIAVYRIKGIVHAVPTATTPGSTVPFYVQIIKPGDVIEANWSTTVECSSGATCVFVTSNIGRYVGMGGAVAGSTAAICGKYIDPSYASTSPAMGGSTGTETFLRIDGFSTQNDVVWGVINTSHLV